VIVAGGVVRARDLGITGEATIDCIRQFRVDCAIVGISGIEDDGTLRDFDFREVQVSKVIIAQARKVILVADHSKFGRPALVRLGHLSQIDILVTDRPPPEAMRKVIDEAGVTVVTADGATADADGVDGVRDVLPLSV
jgi:DeoR family glycerol-3-phosphate regulon repressor